MSELTGSGLAVTLPAGWEGEIFSRASADAGRTLRSPDGAASLGTDDGEFDDGGYDDIEVARNVVHLANFALPVERGDFGSGAVELMNSGALLVILFEHGPESVDTALFARSEVPRLDPSEFDPQQMQRTLAGQSGRQIFFNVSGRAFCLYVVLGSHRRRNVLVPLVNEILASLVIKPV